MKHTNKKKQIRIILFILSAIILSIFIINQITVVPFISIFRSLTGLAQTQGNPGPHEEAIDTVEKLSRVSVSVDGYPDADVTFFAPKGNDKILPVVIYIHGGGWSIGSASSVEWFAKLIASNGYIVANVDYALAPEYPYPTSTVQLASVLDYVYENSEQYQIDPTKIFIGGNSAGAHLASQLGALATNEAYAKEARVTLKTPGDCIKGLLLFNGVYNFDTAGDCHFPFYKKLVWSYTGEKNYLQYDRLDELSSIKHITKSYPATFITVGDVDPLKSETTAFIDELNAKGVDNNSLLWEGTGVGLHHDYIYEQQTEEAQKALQMALTFMEEHIKDINP